MLLRVVRRWIEAYYWPRDRVLSVLLQLAGEVDAGPVAVVPSQPARSGQATLNRLFDRVLRERHVAKHPLTAGARVHVYLDDLSCTGRSLERHLRRLLASLPTGSHVVVFHVVEHTHDPRGVRTGIEAAARERGIVLRFTAGASLQNDPVALGGLEVVMPTPWAAHALIAEHPKVGRKAFRERDLFGDGPLFADADERDVVERALLRVGSRLATWDKQLQPLGVGPAGSLGFGAVAFTFHSAPNTMPLALWWPHQWFPLVPRQSSASSTSRISSP